MTTFGYARALMDGRSVDGRVRPLTDAGCEKVFRKVANGAKADRAQFDRAELQR